VSRHMKFLGLCIVDRETRVHENHLFFSAGELEMPGFVETIAKTYDGSQWEAVRADDCLAWMVTAELEGASVVRGLHQPERVPGPDEGPGPEAA
jgi:hypothetical protein